MADKILDREEEQRPTQYIIKDANSAFRMKKVEAKEAAARYKAIIKKTNAEARVEIIKLKLQISAKEAASKHIAIFGPLYLLLLVASFLLSVSYIPESQISVVSALLTLLITMIGSNLRSIVSEGSDDDNGKNKKKDDKK
tara:strand:+ start:299 stop:718 length:420 start_codon:yes stop_codon:yes gene_type:complete